MCQGTEAIEIYDHGSFVRQIIVHPDEKRCIIVSNANVKMFSLHSVEHLMDFDTNDFSIWAGALFDSTTLMAYTTRAEIVFWSLSNGAMSLRCRKRKVKLDLKLPQIVPLHPKQFMIIGNQTKKDVIETKAIAYILGKRSPEAPTVDSATLRVVFTCHLPKDIRAIFPHRNRVAMCTSGSSKVQIWAWESDKFQPIKVLDVGFVASTVALSETYILCTAYSSNVVHVYISSTMLLIRKLTCPLPVSQFVAIHNDMVLVICDRCKETSLAILDIDAGAVLWKVDFGTAIYRCQLSFSQNFGAHLILATSERKVLQYPLPSSIASKFIESDSLTVGRLQPLQEALSRCLAGEGSPAEYCASLITFSRCRLSFPEWCSAHQLLVLAVRNGDIDKSTEHNESIAHWFKNLYLALKDLDLTSVEDLLVAERYLREAKQMGLIEGIEAVLAALHVTGHVDREVRALHRAGILIFENVMRIEKRFDMLKSACEQYRKHQMYSQLIGIALQIIPIVGGASAGVISAGANMVSGISIKDVADYAFGLGSSLADGEIPTFGNRICRRAAEAISPESVSKLMESERLLLEEPISACGLSVDELRRLLIERSKEDFEDCADDMFHRKSKEVSSSEETDILDGGSVLADEILESDKNNIDFSLGVQKRHFDQESNAKASNSDALIEETMTTGCILGRKPSSLKSCEMKRDSIEKMTQMEIAALIAAFIVRFDDNWVDMFVTFRDRMAHILVGNHLDGALMADRRAVSATELTETILEGLKTDGKGSLTLGVTGKVRQFFNMLG